MLRDKGLVECRRGHGIIVADSPARGAGLDRVREVVTFAAQQ